MNRNEQTIVAQAMQQTFELGVLPFSRYGSYWVIDILSDNDSPKLWIRDIRGGDLDPGCQYEIRIYHENRLVKVDELTIQMQPDNLQIGIKDCPEAYVRFCMPLAGQLMGQGSGLTLQLNYAHRRYDSIYPLADDTYELTSYSKEIKYKLRSYAGSLNIDAPWERIGSSKIELTWTSDFEWLLTSYTVVEPVGMSIPKNFEEGLSWVQDAYRQWLEGFEPFMRFAAEQRSNNTQIERMGEAVYIMWLNFVEPEGLIKRPAMYMTKHYMTNIWSWDNCFGAIALAAAWPKLAWDQLMFFSDLQHESGAYPDYANNRYASFSSLKPPIYGWAYETMCAINSEFEKPEYMAEFYESIAKQTDFWLTERMTALGLPCYRHGNDSGWDNGTFYELGVPVVTPDLAALLIRQLQTLNKLAIRLERDLEADNWLQWQHRLTERLVSVLWDDTRTSFTAIHVPSMTPVTAGDSLQRFLPLLIAPLLPSTIVETLCAQLEEADRFLLRYGLATEAKTSPFYKYNGYWRGPIWAPSTLLMIEALKASGKTGLADSVRLKWLSLIEKSGFYENFDPVTGEGLVDPGFAWTAAVFLHLLNETSA